ncbi:zinc-binding alcohol dehydrogenase family protein [Rhodococcus triatomae BKS 15-14]|nr:zinc-binding alcohol dehydrogenase family protein [Rhodococcus triatomae BKS 15-14]
MRMHAAALNYRDVMIMRGDYAIPAATGTVPLSDGAGEVMAIGDGVQSLAVGDRVTSTYFLRWIDGTLTPELVREQFGASRDGVLAEYLLCSEESLVKMPDHLTMEEAATLPCSALTAWSALTGPRPVLPGESVLTLGTGGVSLFAVQLAQLFGARVIAATSSEAKAERIRELGADTVINYQEHPEWDRLVLDATAGRGVDRVIETVGPQTLDRSIRSTAFGGELAHIGGGGFSDPASQTFDPRVLHGRSLTLRRITVGSRCAFEQMNRAITLHQLRPVIDKVVPFADAADAYRRIQERSHVGKAVVAIG